MLQKGTLDLVLARPIGRAKLLLAKYLGGCWFVFLMASVLISGAWLAFALRLGYWSPWFLLTVLVVTAQFAVPYSVAVLVGVWSRSSGVSALAAIAIWMISGAIVEWRTVVKTGVFQQADWLNNSLEVIYTILPKTADVSALNQRLLARAYLSPEALQRVGLTKLPHVDPWFSFGTTAAFVAVVLGLACWMFRRRDF